MLYSRAILILFLFFGFSCLQAQKSFVQLGSGPGFSAVRGQALGDSVVYLQGTVPEYFDWDGERIAESPGDDIFFASADKKGTLNWFKIYGGSGIERIVAAPIIQESGDLWLFYGEAIDSLDIAGMTYKPSVSSFFSFTGYQQTDGNGVKIMAMESQAPLEINAAAWADSPNTFYISGRAEAPVLNGNDTLLYGPLEPFGFILKLDTSFNVLGHCILEGEVDPFGLYLSEDRVYLGANIRDKVDIKGLVIQARVQDHDCLVTSWDKDLNDLSWHYLLGGVYEKSGVKIMEGWQAGNVLVAGHFIGVIADDEGRAFESNGFDPDLFIWEFTSDGEPVSGQTTGSPGRETMIDAYKQNDDIGLLVQFTETADIFDKSYSAGEEGFHLGIFAVRSTLATEIESIFLGAPAVIGFDLLRIAEKWGLIGGVGARVLDINGETLLEKSGTGQYDYFIWPFDLFTRVEKQFLSADVRIYPNPFRDLVNIKIQSLNKPISYRVIDVSGTELEKGLIPNMETTLDLGSYSGAQILILELWSAGERVYSQLLFAHP